MSVQFSPQRNPRVIIIQKLYGKIFNNEENEENAEDNNDEKPRIFGDIILDVAQQSEHLKFIKLLIQLKLILYLTQ